MFLRCALAVLISCGAVDSLTAAELSSEQESLYKTLEETLSGAALVGHFTVSGRDTSELSAERYELTSVKHIGEGNWLFVARIKYGEHDVTLPITLPIKWAGNTPVISVDKISFPGLGTYSARVMIHEGHYAGFWSGAKHGGHLFGVVEPNHSNKQPSNKQPNAAGQPNPTGDK